MKKYVKIISIMLLAIMLISTVSTTCFATQSVITDIDGKIGTDYGAVDKNGKIADTAAKIIKIIRYVAIVVAVVLIAVFGLKFMLGSAEEKAEYKKSFIPLIVGVVVVFASTYIAQVIFNIAS